MFDDEEEEIADELDELDYSERNELTRGIHWEEAIKMLGLWDMHDARKNSVGAIYMRCIFHDEKTPSLRLQDEHKPFDYPHFECFGCGQVGDLLEFVSLLHSLESVKEILALLPKGRAEIQTDPRQLSLPFAS